MGSTYIVTGYRGFIGKKLSENLISSGNSIIGIDEDYLSSDSWEDDLLRMLENSNCQGIFHVGACSDTLEQNVNYMMIRNYQSTKIISDWCSNNNVPLVYSSSAANYGVNKSYPSNLYGWSKYVSEDYVVNMGGVALRYFNVYGPGEELKGRMSSVAYQMFIKNSQEQEIKIFPKKPLRDFVYIEDVINANIYSLQNFKDIKGKYYEVGTGTPRSFEDVLNLMGIEFSYLNENQIPKGYQFFTQSDTTKWLPGWVSEWPLERGIENYLSYLKSC